MALKAKTLQKGHYHLVIERVNYILIELNVSKVTWTLLKA